MTISANSYGRPAISLGTWLTSLPTPRSRLLSPNRRYRLLIVRLRSLYLNTLYLLLLVGCIGCTAQIVVSADDNHMTSSTRLLLKNQSISWSTDLVSTDEASPSGRLAQVSKPHSIVSAGEDEGGGVLARPTAARPPLRLYEMGQHPLFELHHHPTSAMHHRHFSPTKKRKRKSDDAAINPAEMLKTHMTYLTTAAAFESPPDANGSPTLTTAQIDDICALPDYCSRIRAIVGMRIRLPVCTMFDLVQIVYTNEKEPHFEGEMDECGVNTTVKLQSYFGQRESCVNTLVGLLEQDNQVSTSISYFDAILSKYPCLANFNSTVAQANGTQPVKLMDEGVDFQTIAVPAAGSSICSDCRRAYKYWLCTQHFVLYVPVETKQSEPESDSEEEMDAAGSVREDSTGSPPAPSSPLPTLPPRSPNPLTSPGGQTLRRVLPCSSWCTYVERLCPYLRPTETDYNGGEPAFLCDESHYHHSSRYRGVEEDGCGLPIPHRCCYSWVHLITWQQGQPTEDPLGADTADDNQTAATDCQPLSKLCVQINAEPANTTGAAPVRLHANSVLVLATTLLPLLLLTPLLHSATTNRSSSPYCRAPDAPAELIQLPTTHAASQLTSWLPRGFT